MGKNKRTDRDVSPSGNPDEVVVRRNIADLKPLGVLAAYARAAPGAERPPEALSGKARGQWPPYRLVVAGSEVLFGMGLLAEAERNGVVTVEVVWRPDLEKSPAADRALVAACYHLLAVRERVKPDGFELRRMRAALYATWAAARLRRNPRRTPIDLREKRERERTALISSSFGCSRRVLERDVVLFTLRPDLQESARRKQLPMRAIGPAVLLAAENQDRLAAQLAAGAKFKDVEAEFFEPGDGRRKTDASAFAFVRKCIHQMVRELRDREDRFGLAADDRQYAERLVTVLTDKLAEPVPPSVDDMVAEAVAGLTAGDRQNPCEDAATATRGNRGAGKVSQ